MPTIPLMAYNVFTAMDQTYWTGYPTAENPYTDPVPNWGNSRAMFVKLKPANRRGGSGVVSGQIAGLSGDGRSHLGIS